jgi:hypothetical protein
MKFHSLLKTILLPVTMLTATQTSFAQWTTTSPGGTSAEFNHGNIGINIPTASTAAQPLHVVGKTRFDIGQTTGSGNGRMFLTRTSNINEECLLSFGTGPFATGTSTYDWVQGTYASTTANSDFVIVGNTAGRTFTSLQSNGFVGIGSTATTPQTRLQVGGDILATTSTGVPASAAQIHANTTFSTFGLPDYTWSGDLQTGIFHPAAKTIGFAIGNTEAVRIASNGFIGVGITNPTQMLHMNNGAILLQGNVSGLGGPQILLGGTPGVQTYGQYGIEYESAAMAGAANGGLNFWKPFLSTGVGANNILFLSDNAMVGVNTPSPTAQLTVNGTTLIGDPSVVSLPAGYKLYVQTGILTEKVRVSVVNSGTWADYVFADKYALPSLQEVAGYIKTNKHLPGIPSAAEVEKNGVDLVEMDAALLKKIEEMTLYMMEQNKRIERLENELKEKH